MWAAAKGPGEAAARQMAATAAVEAGWPSAHRANIVSDYTGDGDTDIRVPYRFVGLDDAVFTVDFRKLGTKCKVSARLRKQPMPHLDVNISGVSDDEEWPHPVIMAEIRTIKGRRRLTVNNFFYSFSLSPERLATKKAARRLFRGDAPNFPGYGPRGFLVVRWIAANFKCDYIVLEDSWRRLAGVPAADADTYGLAVDPDTKLTFYGSMHYATIFNLLKERDRGDHGAEARLQKTAYGIEAMKEKLDAEYATALKDGVVDNVIAAGWYGRFGFTELDADEADCSVRVENMVGTRVRFLF